MKLRPLLQRLFIAAAALAPVPAHAGGQDVTDAIVDLILKFAPLWITAAILVVIIAGFSLMVSQEEGRLDKAKKTITFVVIGGILVTVILVLGPTDFVSIMYNGIPGLVLIDTGNVIGEEAIGIAHWLTAVAAMFGIFVVIVSVLRAIINLGKEDEYQNARMALLHIIFGLIIIVAAFMFQRVFFIDRTPNALIALIASKLLLVLAVITTVAVAVLVYAGFRMIISFGQEDQFSAAKSLAYRVALGLVIILVSYALVIAVALLFA